MAYADQYHDLAVQYLNKAQQLRKQNRYLEAAQMFSKSAEAERKSSRPKLAVLSAELTASGYMYFKTGQYDKAIQQYNEALKIARKLGQEDYIAVYLNNVGLVYNSWGQYDKAIQHFNEALKIARKLGRVASIANNLNNIGSVYYSWGKYDKAIQHFIESIQIKEKIRKTAKGDIRRDYLASQLDTYQFLIATYVKTKQYHEAINAIELSRARSLSEKLRGIY